MKYLICRASTRFWHSDEGYIKELRLPKKFENKCVDLNEDECWEAGKLWYFNSKVMIELNDLKELMELCHSREVSSVIVEAAGDNTSGVEGTLLIYDDYIE